MIKKIIPHFLLIVFLYNTAGYYIAYKLLSVEIRLTVMSRIEKDLNSGNCQIIRIPKAQLANIEFEDDGNEIKWGDKYFDIIKRIELKDVVVFYCFDDSKEQMLNSLYASHTKSNDPHNNPFHGSRPVKKGFSNLLKKLFVESQEQFLFSYTTINYPVCYSVNIEDLSVRELLLPPKIA